MKQITAIGAILLASLAAGGSASAQDHAIKANVPFGFYVENKWVPPGTYILSSESNSPNVIAIRNGDSTVSLLNVGHTVDPQPGVGKLTFRKYGDRYFLREISCSRCRMNIGFNPSKREKEERTREASNSVGTTVYLALK